MKNRRRICEKLFDEYTKKNFHVVVSRIASRVLIEIRVFNERRWMLTENKFEKIGSRKEEEIEVGPWNDVQAKYFLATYIWTGYLYT